MKEAVVNANKISVRAKRTHDSTQLGTFSRDDVVTVLDNALDQDYAMVIWKVGYAYSQTGKYIRMVSSEAEPPKTNAVVTANLISVREGRGFINTRLGYYHKDDEIIVLDPALDQTYAKVIWQIGYAYSAKGKYLRFQDAVPETSAEPETPTGPETPNEPETPNVPETPTAPENPNAPETPTEPNAVVTAGRISVREARTVNSTKLGELTNGDKVIVLDETLDQDYAQIVWNNGTGYAYSLKGRYIQFLVNNEPEAPAPNAIVTAGVISVREARTSDSAKLGELKSGAKITVLDDALDQNYAQIVWNGGTGYAYSAEGKYIRFLTTAGEIADLIKSVLDVAKTCVGGKYMLGGQGTRITEAYVRARQKAKPSYYTNGRFEFLLALGEKCDAANTWHFPEDFAWDCSGLWWYSANKAGVYGKSLDSTAHTFYHTYCTPITKAELKAGDAVFYENSSGKITHMAVVGEGGVVYEAMSGYTGVVKGDSVDDRTAPKIVGSGNLTRSAWNKFGRPKIFLTE